jgi:hypothetical protein
MLSSMLSALQLRGIEFSCNWFLYICFYGFFISVEKNPLLLPPRYENQALSRGMMGDDSSAAYLGQEHMDRPVSSKLPASAKG